MVIVTIRLDRARYQYSYPCEEGQCAGYAGDVWSNLSAEQRQEYVDHVLDALMAALPGPSTYQLMIFGTAGTAGTSSFAAFVSKAIAQNEERSYEGI